MKKRKFIRYIVGVVASILLLISLLIGSIEVGAFGSLSFFEKQYTKLAVDEDVDMEMSDLMVLTKEMLRYLKGTRDDLDIVTVIGGKEQEFFNQREKDHMVDVRNLNLNAIVVGVVCFLAAVIMYFALYMYLRVEYKKARPAIDGGIMPPLPSMVLTWVFSVTMLIGTGIYLFVISLGALIVSTNFTKYWFMFHEIFFSNDLWLLDPDTDRLINIVPEEFFTALVSKIAIIYVVILALILIFCIRKIIRIKRERSLGKRRFRLEMEDKLAKLLIIGFLGGMLLEPRSFYADENSKEYEQVMEKLDAIPKEYPWPAAPEITAKHAIIMEAGTGMILYGKDALGSCFPASTTKIMTAYLALNFAASNEGSDILTFSRNACLSLPAGASHIGIVPGEQLSFYDSLCGLLLPSANEVANGLAEYVSGSTQDFVKKMNETATLLGCVNTTFKNPSGLHNDKHTTCAYDLAKIFMACLSQPKFIEIAKMPTYIIDETNLTDEKRPIKNTHRMLHKTDKYYDPRVICGKTGTTKEAGACLVTYAKSGDLSLVVVVMDTEAPNQYEDTKILLDYGFSSFSKVNIAANDQRFYEKKNTTGLLTAGSNQLTFYEFDSHASIIIPTGVSLLDLTTHVVESIQTDYRKIQYYLGDYLLGEADILDATLSFMDYQSPLTNKAVGIYPYQSLQPLKSESKIKQSYTFVIIGVVLVVSILLAGIGYMRRKKRKHRSYELKNHWK